MIQNLDLNILKDKYNISDIESIPKVESTVTLEAVQQLLTSTNEFCWATDVGDEIIMMVTIDSYLGFEALENTKLLGQECLLINDNVRKNTRVEKVIFNVIEGGEKQDPSSKSTFKEQGLYMYSDTADYHGYIPNGELYGKQYGFYLGEVHNSNGIYSVTILFRVGGMKAAKKKVTKVPKAKDLYIDKEQFQIVDACYELRKPCLLMGPTGSGKTTIIRELCKIKKQKFTRINLNGEITKEDLIGSKTLEAGTVVWKDGPLTQALREGDVILLDEINAALPEVLLLIQSLTEAQNGKLGELRLNENHGELLTPHEDCRIFATGNPSDEYIGTKDFNPATLSRWIVLFIDYLGKADEKALLLGKYGKHLGTKLGVVTDIVEFADKLRKMKKKEDLIYSCSTRDLEQAIELFSMGVKMSTALETAIYNKAQNSDDKELLKNELDKLDKSFLDITL